MSERIDIVVPDEVIALNDEKRGRLERVDRFEPVDRAPVHCDVNQWFLLSARGVRYGNYTASPRENLRQQLLNLKWQYEHVRDDLPVPTGRIVVGPDLGCLRGTEFEMNVTWPADQPPKCEHPLREVEQIDDLAVPDPAGGVNARRLAFYRGMREAMDEFDVRVNGERLELDVTIDQPGGPIPAAFALAGQNVMLWMMMDPDRTHRLFEIVTESHLNCIACFDELTGRSSDHPVGMGADAAEMLGPEQYREFVVPYYRRIWERYPGRRGLHMCGRIDHLLAILRDELELDAIDGFGFPVDRRTLADEMAGRVRLSGGPSPMLLKTGDRARIVAECMDYIRTVGRAGGFVLRSGGGFAIGTPTETFDAMTEASRQAAATERPTTTRS